ncbi:hypothetical protein [Myxococcus stipitatus]|uniref:hypothetical protein n=1 Tax=Myxococcus stipitatus TaxID=83455 RepID=UPI0030D38263
MPSDFFDDNGFQDVRNVEPRGSNLSAADDRTLRMASLVLDRALLDALMSYQRAFLADAEAGTGAIDVAQAHTRALEASKLEPLTAERGIALLRAFGGRRWTVRKLQDKLRQLEGASDARAEELRPRIRGELASQERETDALGRRYGDTTVALLREHEDVLVDLHTRMTHLLSRG